MCMLADAAPHPLVGGLRGPQVPDAIVGNSSSCVLDQADASGYLGEEEEEFDNASEDSRFVSDGHFSDDEEDSHLAQHGFHIQNMIAR